MRVLAGIISKKSILTIWIPYYQTYRILLLEGLPAKYILIVW